jgi:hypothetical protein
MAGHDDVHVVGDALAQCEGKEEAPTVTTQPGRDE